MSEIQHKSLRDEILFVIGRSSIALNGSEIYERCKLADEMKQVSNALFQLKDIGKIVAVEGEGRPRYKLAAGVTAPAPAGKEGRPAAASPAPASVLADLADATGRLTVGFPIDGIRPPLDIPVLGLPIATSVVLPGQRVQQRLARIAESDPGAASLADALIATSRQQLQPTTAVQHPRWWIDQDGRVELAHPGAGDTITLSAHQAARLAEMVLAAHAVLEL